MFGLGTGILLGLAARGLMSVGPGWETSIRWINREVLEPFGQVFLRMLFFVVVPLVFSSLALGVVQLRRLDRLGPLAGRTFAMFGLNMAVGVGLGLLMMNVLSPGTKIAPETREELLGQYGGAVETIQSRAAQQESLSFRVLVEMFMPRNLVRSVVEFQLLPLILFALLVGAAGTRLAEGYREGMSSVLQVVMQLMTEIVHYALWLAPYGVAALVGSVVVVAGAEVLRPLIWFVAGVVGVLALHLFGSMSVFLKLFSRRSPRDFFRAVRSVLITAFSTSSSSATLPTSLQVSQEVLKVSPSTAGFVLPLGATMNMSGTALYEGCVVLFVAQVYGVDLSLGSQLTLLVLAVLSAVAVAGIPGASLPVLVGLLASFNLPAEGIALILGFDRLLDMARTAVNVGADLVTACVVDERMEPHAGNRLST
jgi:DAACS family dicarboxylate/amino acid:cation (Na+ or H+) symporter